MAMNRAINLENPSRGSGLLDAARRALQAIPRWLNALKRYRPHDAHGCPPGWERNVRLPEGREILIRPLRPEDEALYPAFLQRVTLQDRRLRFFTPIMKFSAASIAQFTHVDFAKAVAFAAIDCASGELVGVARLHLYPSGTSAEFAILVRSDLKGHGLGWILMTILIEYGRWLGLSAIEGDVLPDNKLMLQMCDELGFRISTNPADPSLKSVRLSLRKRPPLLHW
jgi:acetyltransferase